MSKRTGKRRKKSQPLSRWLIVGGLLVMVAAVLLLKGGQAPQAAESSAEGAPQARLAQALEEGKPILAFYHSNNCVSCLEMIEIVNQVYPEYREEVVLVDVNVYDPQNKALLQAVDLRYIPTQMIYDRSGSHQTVVGVMPPEQLREALAAAAQGR